jgi:hypothetical protein
MKVELLVNLKVASGRVLSKGTVFSDAVEPIPDFIMKRLARGMAKVIETTPAPVAVKAKVISSAPLVSEELTKIIKESAPKEEDAEDVEDTDDGGNEDISDSVKKVVMKKKIKK